MSVARTVVRYRASTQQWDAPQQDRLVEEVPIALVLNGVSHAVMLACPSDLEDFALGFAITEGLIESVSECYDVETDVSALGIEVRLEVSARAEHALKLKRRSLAGRTGCGICGVDSLNQVQRDLTPLTLTEQSLHISPHRLQQIFMAMSSMQVEQSHTGACHAAAWCGADGEILLLREDVGRHNALDKVIGAALKAGMNPEQACIAISSRASFEMVQKTVAARVGMLLAVSAPTALAVAHSERLGLALAGFVRAEGFVAYHQATRFGLQPI